MCQHIPHKNDRRRAFGVAVRSASECVCVHACMHVCAVCIYCFFGRTRMRTRKPACMKKIYNYNRIIHTNIKQTDRQSDRPKTGIAI